MENEINRRCSLYFYRPRKINNFQDHLNNFAFHGFYWIFQNNRSAIVCYFCNLKCLSLESSETNPFGLHAKYNPTCPLVNNRQTSNIPAPENINRTFPLLNNSTGIVYAARFPEFICKTKREMSFSNWPRNSLMQVKDLVGAGFFYLGERDKVACFACGLGLSDFEDYDVPMAEHKKFAENCEFVSRKLDSKL